MHSFILSSIQNTSRDLVFPIQYDMIRGNGKHQSKCTLKWAPETKTTFLEAKSCVHDFTALVFPVTGARFLQVIDASNDSAAAVQKKEVDGMIQPLGLF